jgi:hypothetical protein
VKFKHKKNDEFIERTFFLINPSWSNQIAEKVKFQMQEATADL